jgi:hypothetical protein
MAGVHRLKHVQRFSTTNLANDDPHATVQRSPGMYSFPNTEHDEEQHALCSGAGYAFC